MMPAIRNDPNRQHHRREHQPASNTSGGNRYRCVRRVLERPRRRIPIGNRRQFSLPNAGNFFFQRRLHLAGQNPDCDLSGHLVHPQPIPTGAAAADSGSNFTSANADSGGHPGIRGSVSPRAHKSTLPIPCQIRFDRISTRTDDRVTIRSPAKYSPPLRLRATSPIAAQFSLGDVPGLHCRAQSI